MYKTTNYIHPLTYQPVGQLHIDGLGMWSGDFSHSNHMPKLAERHEAW